MLRIIYICKYTSISINLNEELNAFSSFIIYIYIRNFNEFILNFEENIIIHIIYFPFNHLRNLFIVTVDINLYILYYIY